MTRNLTICGACGLMALLTTGCLVKETSETWYVNPNGDVTWVVTETDVRSDANTAADRREEEAGYWLAVQQERHPVACGLQELGGLKVRTLVLRGESPYTVHTEARFTGLDELGRRILASTGAMGTSIVTRDGAVWNWKLVVRDPSSLMSVSEPSEGVSALMNDLESLRVVLTNGHFDDAEGFTLSGDGRVATFLKKDQPAHDKTEEPTITLRLVWK